MVIRTNLDLKETPCPVNPENSMEWTERERKKASAAPVATSIDDLREKASALIPKTILLLMSTPA
jgi:hypothetical protein